MYHLATIYFVLCHRQADGQTDDSMVPTADYTACSSVIS